MPDADPKYSQLKIIIFTANIINSGSEYKTAYVNFYDDLYQGTNNYTAYSPLAYTFIAATARIQKTLDPTHETLGIMIDNPYTFYGTTVVVPNSLELTFMCFIKEKDLSGFK